MGKTILHFICTTPKTYSGFDRFNLVLSQELSFKGYLSVFVFLDDIQPIDIIDDLRSEKSVVKILNSQKGKINLFLQILRLFISYRPVIVHVHFVEYIKLYISIIRYFFRTEYFLSVHSMITSLSPKEYQKKKGLIKYYLLVCYLKFQLFNAKKVFCISEAVANQFKDFSKCNNNFKIKKLSLGTQILPLNSDKKSVRLKFNFPSHHVLIANIGALEYLKGIETLLGAISLLNKDTEVMDFLIIHIGGLRENSVENNNYVEKLKRRAILSGIEEKIHFLGNRNDVAQMLPAFDIYVHPSLSEGLGVSIMEACASGLPVVASKTGGIPEIVKDGMNGLLFVPGNEVDLALKLKLLINDPELRTGMGRLSSVIVSESYNVNIQANKYADEYESVFLK